ncbi:hypothetical protein FFK22_026640 [Mycobacterium sp. KBS0706]|uniref:hypothetical protein n=1 Tax=Mycobacterium sp. KBS0706 TaxID=2578109 RepID=UPI00110FDEEE|nr:hypothetical protein [Mycobacterium sp. KBS0706]TSD85625.1 hypothetical protein FFK22_026640 [Mycobacterium sp. KBS0706]
MIGNFLGKLGAIRVAILSAAIALPASASAATPQQCATLKALLNSTGALERTLLEQREVLLAQPPSLAGALLALQAKYKGFDEADFRGIRDVTTRLEGVSTALTGDFDARLKVLNDSITVIGELCR